MIKGGERVRGSKGGSGGLGGGRATGVDDSNLNFDE